MNGWMGSCGEKRKGAPREAVNVFLSLFLAWTSGTNSLGVAESVGTNRRLIGCKEKCGVKLGRG